MLLEQSIIKFNKGFSIVEAVLSIALIAVFVTGFSLAFVYGREASQLSEQREKAIFLAEEGLEVARQIRDSGYTNLTTGSFGVSTSTGSATLVAGSDINSIYTRQITVANIDSFRKGVTSTVTWQQNLRRSGTVVAYTELTNWMRAGVVINSCATYCQSIGNTTGTCRRNGGDCNANNEVWKTGGDIYCTIGLNRTCCCKP